MSLSPSSSGVAPSSQNVWQRYIPRSPSPRNPIRSRSRSAASTLAGLTPSWVIARCIACRVSEVRARAAVRQPVRVVRVEQQAADAVLELALDRALLLG